MNTIKRKTAFTLQEIMIVLSIIGLLIASTIPFLARTRKQSRMAHISHRLRIAGNAFVLYALENTDYPPETGTRLTPPGMETYLRSFGWEEDTEIGGFWDWDLNRFAIKAGVSIYKPDWDADLLQELDEMVDDGNLHAGQYRLFPNRYTYIIEE